MLSYSLIVFLIYNSINSRRDRTILFSRISFAILLYSMLISYNNLNFALLDTGIGLFNGLFHMTSMIHVFQIFIMFLSTLIIGLTSFYPRKVWIMNHSSLYKLMFFRLVYAYRTVIINKMSEQFSIMEYSLMLLFTIAGALLLTSSCDLISIFLCIELQSYGLYLICTVYRDSELSTSGGLTYFLLGGLSSCFILLASSLIYINSGTTSLDIFYAINNIPELFLDTNNTYKCYYISLGFILMIVGLLFKISAAPFHFWSPDVYDYIPSIVTTFVAIIAKVSIFILLLQLIYFTNKSLIFFDWTITLLISSLFSLIVGTVLGLIQYRIKKLYAYSTISHVGFILLALSIHNTESIQAFVFYLLQYSITNLNAFIILLAIGYSLFLYFNSCNTNRNFRDKNNSPLQLISQIKGYFYINPYLSLSLTVTLFSFIGIPPLIGFFAKQMVLNTALDNGYIFMCFVGILTSVISAVYYLFIIKQVFFEKSEYKIISLLKDYIFIGRLYNYNSKQNIRFSHNNIVISSYLSITIAVLTLTLMVSLFVNKYLLNMASILTLTIY